MAHGSAPRRPWLRGGVAALAVASVAVVGLAANGWSLDRVLNTCMGQDREELAELRPVTAKTLRSVEYQSSDYYGCEDTGKPGDAAVISDVLSLRQRSAANEYLVTEGWVKQDFVTFHSPNGEHSAHVIMGKEPGVARHAFIYFGHAD